MIGPFGPIHIFCVITYISLFNGLSAVIVKRDIARHRAEMQGLYVNALLLARRVQLPARPPHAPGAVWPDGWTESVMAAGAILAVVALVTVRLRRPRKYRPA